MIDIPLIHLSFPLSTVILSEVHMTLHGVFSTLDLKDDPNLPRGVMLSLIKNVLDLLDAPLKTPSHTIENVKNRHSKNRGRYSIIR